MSVLEVDLCAIKKNLEYIKQLLNYNQKICFVAKANCYGLGMKKLCEFLNTQDIFMFAVSCESEFLKLKRVVSKPILILQPIYKNITKLAKQDAILTISNFESVQIVLSEAGKNLNINYNVHIAVNTGMNRFGFKRKEDILKVFEKLEKVQNICILGVFSHYFDANNESFAKKQTDKFLKIKRYLAKNGYGENLIFHISASDAVGCDECFDMVRIGMKMLSDSKFSTIKLKSKILDFQNLKPNETAGYGAVFVANKKTRLAVVGIGYADGVFRNVYKKGYVLINDKWAKIVAVCMDCLLVDATNISCKIYDDVVLIGKEKNEQIFVCDVACWCDTIEYEIIAGLTGRIKRKYIRWSYANYNRKVSCKETGCCWRWHNKANTCKG